MSVQDKNIVTHLSEIEERERKLAIEKALALNKAIHSQDVDTIYKAQGYINQFINNKQQFTAKLDGMKSIVIDPFESQTSMGYFNKHSSLSFEALRAMSRAPIIRAIINTRKDQVAEFTKLQPDKYSKGFVIKKKGIDEDEDLTDGDKKIIDQLVSFVLNCGDDDSKWDLDGFEVFIRKIVEDSLVLDQATFEIIPTRGFEPTQIVAVDAATFRIADSYDNDNNIHDTAKVLGYYPSFVQVYQNNIVSEFYPWELCFGIRNPSTSIRSNGYGRSELEDLMSTVTSMLNADSYNGKFFRHGSAPKGALLVKKGNINPDKIAQLRKDWGAMMSGVDNMHKTPVLDAESVEWLDMQKNNRDMEFGKYQEYLIKLGCAVYKISPEEIGFPLEGTGKGGGLNSGDGKSEKKYSLDKGLKPLLTVVQGWLNKYILGPKTGNAYEFKFVGIDVESAQEEEERLATAVTTYMEVNEVRKARGLKPKPGYDIILSPVISQMRQMDQQSAMDQQQQDQENQQKQEVNKNPFLDDQDTNPFAKSYNDFIKKNLLN